MFLDLWNDAILPGLITIATAAVTVLVAYATKALSAWGEKQKSAVLQNAMRDLAEAARVAVDVVNQTFVLDIKAAREDGKLTRDEIEHAFGAAMGVAKRQLSQATMAVLVDALGSMSGVNMALGDLIEKSVSQAKVWTD